MRSSASDGRRGAANRRSSVRSVTRYGFFTPLDDNKRETIPYFPMIDSTSVVWAAVTDGDANVAHTR
jgi:hypothetical protein